MHPHDRSLLRLLERLDGAGLSGLMPTLLDQLSEVIGAVGVRLLIADVEARRFEMRPGLAAGDVPHSQEIEIEGSVHGRAYTDGADHTCKNWTSSGEGTAQLGHFDRNGGGVSWNSAHPSRGCSQENLVATGGAGLFYCFAGN